MAKINKTDVYNIKPIPDPQDFMPGTEASTGKTFSFRISNLLETISASIDAKSINYVFSDGSDEEITNETPGYFFTNGSSQEPPNISSITFNKETTLEQDLTQLFTFISNNRNSFIIKLIAVSNPNKISYYTINQVTNNTDYFVFSVELFNTTSYNGVYEDSETYLLDFILIDDQSIRIAPAGLPLTLKAKGYQGSTPNTGAGLQVGDICYGFAIPTQYIEAARYDGPDPNSYGSYTIFNATDLE